MKTKMKDKIPCILCGGDAIIGYRDYVEDGVTYHDFPYWKCTQCGEEYLDFDLLHEIEKQKKEEVAAPAV